MEKVLIMPILITVVVIFVIVVLVIGLEQAFGGEQTEIVSKYRIDEQYYFDLHSFRNGVEYTIEVNMTVYYQYMVGSRISESKVREISI